MWFGWDETPDLSKVMSTSMVAVGTSFDFDFMGFVSFGAKAEERREAIFWLDQAVVMLSGKSLCIPSVRVSFREQKKKIREGHTLALDNEHIVLFSQTKRHATLDQFLLACLSKAIGISCVHHEHMSHEQLESMQRTTTQTQNLDMIPQRWIGKCQNGRRKKHSLVIGMRNQQTDSLVSEFRETRTRH